MVSLPRKTLIQAVDCGWNLNKKHQEDESWACMSNPEFFWSAHLVSTHSPNVSSQMSPKPLAITTTKPSSRYHPRPFKSPQTSHLGAAFISSSLFLLPAISLVLFSYWGKKEEKDMNRVSWEGNRRPNNMFSDWCRTDTRLVSLAFVKLFVLILG